MTGIGHNGGPTLEPGFGWRRHCWTAARAGLLPTLPIEVVRLRVPGDGVILVGETALEREWCAAGRLAGWIPAARYFGAGAGEI